MIENLCQNLLSSTKRNCKEVDESTLLDISGLTERRATAKHGFDFYLETTLEKGKKIQMKKKSESSSVHQTFGQECEKPVLLKSIRIGQTFDYPLFMIESSGRPTLDARQACAVESAVLKSGFNVVLILTSPFLDLRDNTTCQIYMRISNLQIFTVHIPTFAIGSIIEKFLTSGSLEKSNWPAAHTSDALRLLLLYEFGGMYLDLDFVVLRDLTPYNHMILKQYGILCNGAISLPCKHPLLAKALKYVETDYRPDCWICIGPHLITKVAQEIGNVSNTDELSPTPLLPVLEEHVLLPHHYDYAVPLYFSEDPISFEEYHSMFVNASAVHFYSALSSHILVEDDPEHFLYALLGPRYCPLSYYSTRYF